jgi:hypothetical protein
VTIDPGEAMISRVGNGLLEYRDQKLDEPGKRMR